MMSTPEPPSHTPRKPTILNFRSLREPSIAQQNEINESVATHATVIEELPRILVNGKEYVKTINIWSKREYQRSWIYSHGTALTELNTKDKYWACNICDSHARKRLFRADSITTAADHLTKVHSLRKNPTEYDDTSFSGINTLSSQTSSQPSIRDAFGRPSKKQKTADSAILIRSFADRFKDLLVRWIVHYQIPLVAVENEYFRLLLTLIMPTLLIVLPRLQTLCECGL